MVEYLIFVRNDQILVVLVDNGFSYNKIRTELIETLEGNHSSGFKAIVVNYSVKKSIVVYLDAKVLVNLLSKTPFHSVITTCTRRRSFRTPTRCYISICATCHTLF
jgi:hypothetical protein